MSSFIFIIPRTPKSDRNGIREKLWHICVETLQNQTYQNWKALVIGHEVEIPANDDRFIIINYEGPKGEKLQKATEFIINNISGDYIVRLDDDDIINPTVLEKVSKLDFDLYADKHQWFWHYESGKISNRVWDWYPNTCIHKREHALTKWGNYASANFKHFKKQALLIENDHSQINKYFSDKKIIYAPMKHPVYLRTITTSSITAKKTSDYKEYLKKFGNWRNNDLKNFKFLINQNSYFKTQPPKLSCKEKLRILLQNSKNKMLFF